VSYVFDFKFIELVAESTYLQELNSS